MDERQRVVVITGASAGVGRATARAFARQGAAVGLIARGRDGLEGARRDVEALGGRALAIPADVADARRMDEAAQQVEDELGPIDVWVNNAMTTVFAPVTQISADEFRRVTEVTYLGYVYSTQAALRRMLPRDRGSIVQVGLALAYRGIPLQAAYCGAKFAIRGFTDSLRTELLHDGSRVHVTMVHLPAVNTPQFSWCEARLPRNPRPVPPVYQPEVCADAIVWAAGQRRREVLVGLPAFLTIEGNKVAPSLGDWYLAKTGYELQQTDEPLDLDRPSNLWEPVEGDRGAHGAFDEQARTSSWMLRLSMHRRAVAGVAGAAGLAAAAMLLRSEPRST